MREKQINKTKHKQTKQLKKKVIETRKEKTKRKTKQNKTQIQNSSGAPHFDGNILIRAQICAG